METGEVQRQSGYKLYYKLDEVMTSDRREWFAYVPRDCSRFEVGLRLGDSWQPSVYQ